MTTPSPKCLGCGAPLHRTWVDLGKQPLANSFVQDADALASEKFYPLHARVCDICLLVQVDRVVPPEQIFNADYAYFSSYSESWLAHCRSYVDQVCERFALSTSSRVVEIASNDGYMLQYFSDKGIPVLGVEPSSNTAAVALKRGIRTEIDFFSQAMAERLKKHGDSADLIAANNVLAHVPEINDFVRGVAALLRPEGVFTVEFPHFLNTSRQCQFDTIYHEHFTYLSLLAVEKIFARAELRVFDVQQVSTHGGSLRVFACLKESAHDTTSAVDAVRRLETDAELDRPAGYEGFTTRCDKVRADLVQFLSETKRAGKTVAGYGAAAKGNTLLNYCGVQRELLPFIADLSLAKQGKLTPGSHIPILPPSAIFEKRPDYVLILPWNLRPEIEGQLAGVRGWGGQFVTAIPELKVH